MAHYFISSAVLACVISTPRHRVCWGSKACTVSRDLNNDIRSSHGIQGHQMYPDVRVRGTVPCRQQVLAQHLDNIAVRPVLRLQREKSIIQAVFYDTLSSFTRGSSTAVSKMHPFSHHNYSDQHTFPHALQFYYNYVLNTRKRL